jgi:hypothetical protein
VISTVDPEARRGHKTSARGFDGYKGYAAIDPALEIITETVVTPAMPATPARPSGSSPISSQVITCPNGVTVVISRHRNGGGQAYFREACATCALRPQCTKAAGGRNIGINAYEEALARARLHRVDPTWRDDYRFTLPKVERKLAHLMRRRHGWATSAGTRHDARRCRLQVARGCGQPGASGHSSDALLTARLDA